MATIREVRQRIKSVKNIAKITKAMETIAASKMRRSQQRVLANRPYAERIIEVLGDLAAQPQGDYVHPLMVVRPVQRELVIHFTADRGLCGGYNANMNRRTATHILQSPVPVALVAVGRRGRDFMIRYGRDVRAEFTNLTDRPNVTDVAPIARIAMDGFSSGEFDRVTLAYNRFVSTAVQRPTLQQLLPVRPEEYENKQVVEYIYEPSPAIVLEQLLPRFVEMQVYQALLEAIASFQSAQMVAMRNATDSANDLISDLTLSYNKARQEQITKELLDLVGGAEALKKA